MKKNTIQPEIRPVSIRENYDLLSEMMRELHLSEQELFDKTDDWDNIREGYMRHVITTQEENDGTCLVAFMGGQPAGFIYGYVEEGEGDSRIEAYTGNDLYISDGYVYPAFRRTGIYKQLNERMEAIYIEKGIRRILRFTLSSNARMQQFLKKENYRPVRYYYEKRQAGQNPVETIINF